MWDSRRAEGLGSFLGHGGVQMLVGRNTETCGHEESLAEGGGEEVQSGDTSRGFTGRLSSLEPCAVKSGQILSWLLAPSALAWPAVLVSTFVPLPSLNGLSLCSLPRRLTCIVTTQAPLSSSFWQGSATGGNLGEGRRTWGPNRALLGLW